MKNYNIFPISLLASFVVLVPLVRCNLFFDSYLIKFWIVQIGVSIIFIYFLWQLLHIKWKLLINVTIVSLLVMYLVINIMSWILIPSPFKYPALLALVATLACISLCFIVSQYLEGNKVQNIVVSLWLLTATGVSLYSIWQYIHKGRVIGTLGNENFLAGYIGITIPVCAGYFLQYLYPVVKNDVSIRRLKPAATTNGVKRNKKVLPLGLIVILLFTITLYFTKSRGSWFGLLFSSCSLAIIGWGPRGKRLLVALLLILTLIALILTPWGVRFIIEQFKGDVRPAIWEGTFYMITQKPWLGWGRGAYFIFYPQFRVQEYWLARTPTDLTIHAHNEFLQIWAETGLIGLITFLVLIFTVIRLGIKKVDSVKESNRFLLLGIICGIIGLLVHNLVCNNMQMPSSAIFLWFTLGMVISYIPSKHIAIKIKRIARTGIFIALTLFIVIINWQVCIKPIISQCFFKKGWNLREKGEWGRVIEDYKRAISWYPWEVEMHYRMAYAYSMNSENDKAINEYNNVIKLAPLYGNAYNNMGIIYMRMGKYKSAIKSFLKSLQINQYDMIAKVNISRINPFRNDY